MLPEAIISAVFDRTPREFDVELWNGGKLPRPGGGPAAVGCLVLRTPAVIGCLAPPLDERAVAEAFLDGQIDVVGDTIAVLEAVARWEGPRFSLRALPRVASAWAGAALSRARELRPAKESSPGKSGTGPGNSGTEGGRVFDARHSISRDARAVQHHYDVSDAFYRLFLDERLVYSCGYFPRGDESIDEAQEAKLELVCRKLGLRAGEQLLDVGCGWGALLLHAVQRFHVRATGTTISRHQFFEARRRATEAGLGSSLQVLDCDYRRLPLDPVDKIVSIGMMEHVGGERLDEYFSQLYGRLRPGGLLLNQAIADISAGVRVVPWLRRPFRGFIDREIFPDSDLPPVGAVLRAAERHGFEVRDVECLREHYAQTLRHWLARLERRFEDAVVQVGRRRARAWRLYLAISAVAFRLGRLGVYQTLLAKRTASGEAAGVPRTRDSWQREPLVDSTRVAATA